MVLTYSSGKTQQKDEKMRKKTKKSAKCLLQNAGNGAIMLYEQGLTFAEERGLPLSFLLKEAIF